MDHPKTCFAPISGSGAGRVRHYVGVPGEEQMESVAELPAPAALLVEVLPEGGVLLIRLAADGGFGGDTWHEDVAAAREQANFEYGSAVGEWRNIPDDTEELEAYVLAQLRERQDLTN